jgi:hypothetical protein
MNKWVTYSMSNQSDLDNELAELTDLLLAGKPVSASPENESYAEVVRGLHGMMSKQRQPDAAFRAKMTKRLNDEWDSNFRQSATRATGNRPMSLSSRLSTRNNRMVAMAAGLVAMLVFVLILLQGSGVLTSTTGMGTAQGTDAAPLIVVAGIVVVAGAFFWLRRR